MTTDPSALDTLARYSGPLSGAPPTVADVVVATLKASGVRRIYGLPGDSLNGLTDALRRDGEVTWQHVRHEESAAFAASGEAATTGGLAVCAASCGPGNLHLVNGLFDAQRSRVTLWAARYLHMNGRRRLIGSFNHGTMANALPQALGVQAAHPDRQVVALSGDGGLAMLMGELLTLRQHRLPVKIVVFDNGALSFVELEMKADGIVNFGTALDNPDFAAVARAVGLHGVRVERPGELDDALREAFTHPGPALVDVVTHRQELALPPTITLHQAKGFTLWATRSLLDGDGSTVVEVTKTNLRQLTTE